MGRYRIVGKPSSTSDNQFIRTCYSEVFWVEQWLPVKRGLFRRRVEMQWVPLTYKLSERTARNYIKELQTPPEPVKERVIWSSDEH